MAYEKQVLSVGLGLGSKDLDTISKRGDGMVGALGEQLVGVDRIAKADNDASGEEPREFFGTRPDIECARDAHRDNLAICSFDKHRDPALELEHLPVGCTRAFWENDHHFPGVEFGDRHLHRAGVACALFDGHGVEILYKPPEGLEVEESASRKEVGLSMTNPNRNSRRIEERLVIGDHQHPALGRNIVDINTLEPIEQDQHKQCSLSEYIKEDQLGNV